MENLKVMLDEAFEVVSGKTSIKPVVGIVLGSGLGALGFEIEDPVSIPYESIPHFSRSTVEGHSGNLIFGKIEGKPVVAMQGRFHFYEGYDIKQVTFPIRFMARLGVSHLILSNAAGGLNRNFYVGDLMVITDHINMTFRNPLIGKNDNSVGPRFLDMSEAYNKEMVKQIESAAVQEGISLRKGVYLCVTGPSYETPAELRFFSQIADAVGMSTVPEIIAARHSGIIHTAAISCITNQAFGDGKKESHDEVVKAANSAGPKFVKLVKRLIKNIQL